MSKVAARWAALLGLILILIYWYWVHPTGFPHALQGARGYMEDLCGPELVRQMMAEQIQRTGHPGFTFNQVMTPFGISIPYMSWMIERDWIGGYFWLWNRDFPFLWFWFGVSLVGSYVGVGLLLKKARLAPAAAWGLATAAVLIHIPRHFKIWYHSEHLFQHWIYWSVFLDVLILSRVFRERRWSMHLELWRGVCLLGMLGTAGYYWGPLMLEWLFARMAIGLFFAKERSRGSTPKLEIARNPAIAAALVGILFLAIDLAWYLPLFEEVQKQPGVSQPLTWFAGKWLYFFPMWYGKLPGHASLDAVLSSETITAIGWTYWIPFFVAIALLRKKKGGPGLLISLPILVTVLVAILYSIGGMPTIHRMIQTAIPFMTYFRVAVRWGLILPPMLAGLVALAWPEISAGYRRMAAKPRKIATALFGAIVLLEASWLSYPVLALPPLPDDVVSILEKIKALPGDTVLNLPFCVAGGNGVCTGEQCPQYPYATVGSCFRGWHDKKVHGLYAARFTGQQCAIYRQAPFTSWFAAWRENRCFNDADWAEFCTYLSVNPNLSAILLFPDIWVGARLPGCRAQFDAHLGPPLGDASFSLERNPGGYYLKGTRVLWYAPTCKK